MPRAGAVLPRNRDPVSSDRPAERAPEGRPKTYLTLMEWQGPLATAEQAYDGTDQGSQRIERSFGARRLTKTVNVNRTVAPA